MAAPGAEKRAAEAKAAAEKAAAAEPAKDTAKKAAPAAKSAGGRKSKDKWKAKEWYQIHAPRMFNETVIGETPAIDPEYLLNRKVEVTVKDLTGDISKMHIKLKFKIVGVDGHEAKTEFIGHEYATDYVRRMTRRKKTKTDHVVDVTTADNFNVRIKTMAISDHRIQASQEDAMRGAIAQYLTQFAAEHKLSDLVKAIISGDMSKDVAKACHTIVPIKRVEIRKTEVLRKGEGEPESIVEVPAEEPEAAAEEAPAEPAEEEAAPAEETPAEEAEAPAEEPSEETQE
jgi:small subunit ribosomal protein S3Ae